MLKLTSQTCRTYTCIHTIKFNHIKFLGIIFISIVFGIAAGFSKEKGKPFVLFFTSLTDIIMIVMTWFMWLVLCDFPMNDNIPRLFIVFRKKDLTWRYLFHDNARKCVHFHLICIKCTHFHEKRCVLCKLVPFFSFSCKNMRISVKMHENAHISKDLYPHR